MPSYLLLGYSGDGVLYRYPPRPNALSQAQAQAALQAAREALHGAGCMTVECSGGFEAWLGDMRRAVYVVEVGAGEFQETA